MNLVMFAIVMFALSIVIGAKAPTLTEERDPQYWDVCPTIHEHL